jgi:hypothetical protein
MKEADTIGFETKFKGVLEFEPWRKCILVRKVSY